MVAILQNDILTLPSTPQIPGVIFRRFRGESDYPHILEAIDGSKIADHIERSDTLEDIANNYAHLRNCDPYLDMVFVEIAGQVKGYSRVWWDTDNEGAWLGFSLCFLLPEWRRKGIGRAILLLNEKRLAEIARQLVMEKLIRPETPLYYDIFTEEGEVGKIALLNQAGYQPIRNFYIMVRPDLENIPQATLPAGLEVRPVLPEHYRAIWEASQEAFEDHWGFIREGEEGYQRWINDPLQDPNLWKVAWDGDQVAGMVLNFINHKENQQYGRKRGWTENISVRRPWRKRGLARSLILQSLHMLREHGLHEAALGVDTENTSGALRLYEGVGFRPFKRSMAYRKKFEIPFFDC